MTIIVFRAMGLAALLAMTAPALAQNTVIPFATDDADMNAAIAKARKNLPEFWSRFAAPAPNEADFSLKLGISDGNQTEHFWCGEIEGNAQDATCVIANEPVDVFTVAYGERVKVNPAEISDWLYYRDDKIVGAETLRVMLPHLEKKEAAAMRALLGEP
jgi:uncharacterized protein YegJ (DUF2314 family)